jgi:hypothetical protein
LVAAGTGSGAARFGGARLTGLLLEQLVELGVPLRTSPSYLRITLKVWLTRSAASSWAGVQRQERARRFWVVPA